MPTLFIDEQRHARESLARNNRSAVDAQHLLPAAGKRLGQARYSCQVAGGREGQVPISSRLPDNKSRIDGHTQRNCVQD